MLPAALGALQPDCPRCLRRGTGKGSVVPSCPLTTCCWLAVGATSHPRISGPSKNKRPSCDLCMLCQELGSEPLGTSGPLERRGDLCARWVSAMMGRNVEPALLLQVLCSRGLGYQLSEGLCRCCWSLSWQWSLTESFQFLWPKASQPPGFGQTGSGDPFVQQLTPCGVPFGQCLFEAQIETCHFVRLV